MSSAVHDLQRAIVSGQQSLTQLLRQTKLIAAKLNLADVEAWVDLELNGYGDVEPPSYREFSIQHIEVYNPVRKWGFAGHWHGKMKAYQPIADIERLSNGNSLQMPLTRNLPTESEISRDWPQRAVISGSTFQHIVEGVRNALLQWTIDLEKRGIKGENMNFDETEKKEAQSITYHIGAVHGVAGAVTNSQVTVYDNSTVQKLLIDHNIPKADRHELENIMDDLKAAPADKKQSLFQRGEALVVKHKEVLGAGAEIVTRALRAYMEK